MAVEPIDFAVGQIDSDTPDFKPIPLAAATVAAFVGRTERGPLNRAVPLRSFGDFERVFGGHRSSSTVSHGVQHFFQHGGQDAVVVRVANRATRSQIDVPAGGEFLHLEARHAGSREFIRVSVDYDGVRGRADRFNLVVQRIGGADSQRVVDQELYNGLSLSSDEPDFVPLRLKASELVRVRAPLPRVRPNATLAAHPGEPLPYIGATRTGSDGDELTDYDVVGSNVEGTGLFALGSLEKIDLLCIPAPPHGDLGVTTFLAAERYCGRRRALLIWDPPRDWSDAATAVQAARHSSRISQNALTYYPRIRPRGASTRYPEGLPACGAIAGILARQAGKGVWKPLSGYDAYIKASLAPVLELSDTEAAMLLRSGVNSLRRAYAGNCAFYGNVTLAGAGVVSSRWQQLGRRRLLFFILDAIETATRWVPASRFDADAARKLEYQVMQFMLRLLDEGALAGTSQEQAFSIAAIQGREGAPSSLSLRVGMALERPGQLSSYRFEYRPDGCVAGPAPAVEAAELAG